MFIAIRKESNGLFYMDKEIYSRMHNTQDEQGNVVIKRVFSDEELSQSPYNYTKIEIDDKYSDCVCLDFDCIDNTFSFNVDKYNARKQKLANEEYEANIVALIRKKYNVNQELAVLRQRDTKPEEFAEYNEYVEECKQKIKEENNGQIN